MPGSRGVLVLALLSLVGQRPLHAECTMDRVTSTAADLVDHVRLLFHGGSSRQNNHSPQVQAQAIPTGGPSGRLGDLTPPTPRADPLPPGPSVDLSDLTRPTAVEDRLRPVLAPGMGKLRLSVVGGTARQGDFSLGSSESLTGPLLVVNGTADIYGRLAGNLVAVRGDVVVHTGAVVTGDVLTMGGHVRDEGGE